MSQFPQDLSFMLSWRISHSFGLGQVPADWESLLSTNGHGVIVSGCYHPTGGWTVASFRVKTHLCVYDKQKPTQGGSPESCEGKHTLLAYSATVFFPCLLENEFPRQMVKESIWPSETREADHPTLSCLITLSNNEAQKTYLMKTHGQFKT